MKAVTLPFLQISDFPPECCNTAFHSLSSLKTGVTSAIYTTTKPISEQLPDSEFP